MLSIEVSARVLLVDRRFFCFGIFIGIRWSRREGGLSPTCENVCEGFRRKPSTCSQHSIVNSITNRNAVNDGMLHVQAEWQSAAERQSVLTVALDLNLMWVEKSSLTPNYCSWVLQYNDPFVLRRGRTRHFHFPIQVFPSAPTSIFKSRAEKKHDRGKRGDHRPY